jgi:hypothetical protein
VEGWDSRSPSLLVAKFAIVNSRKGERAEIRRGLKEGTEREGGDQESETIVIVI